MSEKVEKHFSEGEGRTKPRIEILILNWNLWELTVECLKSIMKSTYPHYDVLIIDNGSLNDSTERLSQWIAAELKGQHGAPRNRLRLVTSERNLGYPGGNNLGIKMILEEGKVDYVLLMNNDVLIAADALEILVENAWKNPSFAFLSPKILHMNPPDRIQCKGARVSKNFIVTKPIGFGEKDTDDPDGVKAVDAVYGACMLARASALPIIGGLDERIRFYSEDIDWCLRAKLMGFMVGCVAKARVWHVGEASTRFLGSDRRFNSGRSRAIMLKRYATLTMRILYPFLMLPKELGTIVKNDRSLSSAVAYTEGFLLASLEIA